MAAIRTLFLAFLCAGIAFAADTPGRRTEELMQKSGLWKQLGYFQAQVRAGIEESRASEARSGQPRIREADIERVQAAGHIAFAPDRLRASVRGDMERLLKPADEAEVLDWLSTDLGMRLTRLEEESEDPAGYALMMREAPKYAKGLPEDRLDRMRRLEKAVQGGAASVEITIGITTAVAYGIASTSRFGNTEMVEKLKEQIEAQRPRMLVMLREQMVTSFGWIYRTVPDEDLDRYAQFAETPAGTAYHAATIKAMTNAIVRASLEMGERIGRADASDPKRGS